MSCIFGILSLIGNVQCCANSLDTARAEWWYVPKCPTDMYNIWHDLIACTSQAFCVNTIGSGLYANHCVSHP
jgi:hypothetical protein